MLKQDKTTETVHTFNESKPATGSPVWWCDNKICSSYNDLFLVGLVLKTHLSTFLVSSCPHLIGEIVQLLCRYVGGAGRLVGGWRVVGAVLVQLGRSVSIFWSVGSDCHSFGLYPHHDRFFLKHPDLLPQVPVGLTTTCTVTWLSDHTNYTVCHLCNSSPVQMYFGENFYKHQILSDKKDVWMLPVVHQLLIWKWWTSCRSSQTHSSGTWAGRRPQREPPPPAHQWERSIKPEPTQVDFTFKTSAFISFINVEPSDSDRTTGQVFRFMNKSFQSQHQFKKMKGNWNFVLWSGQRSLASWGVLSGISRRMTTHRLWLGRTFCPHGATWTTGRAVSQWEKKISQDKNKPHFTV